MNTIGQMSNIQICLIDIAAKIHSINTLIIIIKPILISIDILRIDTTTT